MHSLQVADNVHIIFRDRCGLGLSMVGSGWVEFFYNYRGLGWVVFNDTVMGWVQRLREMRTRPTCKTFHLIPTTLNR